MMNYTVHYRTDADSAIEEFKADKPEQVLALAHKFYGENAEELDFTPYEGGRFPVNEIEVFDNDGNQVALWYDDELRLRLAARDLLEALESQTDAAHAVINNWARGDLASAVRALDRCVEASRAAIAKAKGGAT